MKDYKFTIEGTIKCEDNVVIHLLNLGSLLTPYQENEDVQDLKISTLTVKELINNKGDL